jgi:hypothetical protein
LCLRDSKQNRTSIVDSFRQTIFVAAAHRGDGQRFIVRADEKLTAFIELESVICKNRIDTLCGRLPESRLR